MKLLRQLIRNLILELNIPKYSLQQRKSYGYFQKPEYDEDLNIPFEDLPRIWKENSDEYDWVPGHGFQHKQEKWWVPNTQLPGFDKLGLDVSNMAWVYEPYVGLKPARSKRKEGRKIKKLFRKSYEQNREFFDSLTYVHWVSNDKIIEKTEGMILGRKPKNEVSATWFDKPPFKNGKLKIGLILSGRPTLISNMNMKSGFASSDDFSSADPDQFIPSFFMAKGGHREKSSGINKYPHQDVIDWDVIVWNESDVDYTKIEKLRAGTSNNEALIDNFEVLGIIVAGELSDSEYNDILELANTANIKLYNSNGIAI